MDCIDLPECTRTESDHEPRTLEPQSLHPHSVVSILLQLIKWGKFEYFKICCSLTPLLSSQFNCPDTCAGRHSIPLSKLDNGVKELFSVIAWMSSIIPVAIFYTNFINYNIPVITIYNFSSHFWQRSWTCPLRCYISRIFSVTTGKGIRIQS